MEIYSALTGFLIVLSFALGQIFGYFLGKEKKTETVKTEKEKQTEELTVQKQLQNLMNYTGELNGDR